MSLKSPFDIVKNLNTDKNYEQTEDPDFQKQYSSWIINKAMANHRQTIFFANEINMRYGLLDTIQQFDFYFYGIPKGKRFGKWRKQAKQDSLNLLMSHYSVNARRAQGIWERLTAEQIKEIEALYYKGGKK